MWWEIKFNSNSGQNSLCVLKTSQGFIGNPPLGGKPTVSYSFTPGSHLPPLTEFWVSIGSGRGVAVARTAWVPSLRLTGPRSARVLVWSGKRLTAPWVPCRSVVGTRRVAESWLPWVPAGLSGIRSGMSGQESSGGSLEEDITDVTLALNDDTRRSEISLEVGGGEEWDITGQRRGVRYH